MKKTPLSATAAFTRRELLKTSASGALLWVDAARAASQNAAMPVTERLTQGWEHYRGDLGGIWEAWRGSRASDNVKWTPVELPHCFNARDSVDPDLPYYQGPGWYRALIPASNPFQAGRTLLHFEGAGQKTRVWVYMTEVASHTGGYDEFVVDITSAAAAVPAEYRDKGVIPVAIRCDNSRDLEMIPSDLSDFHIYGGIYRYLNRICVPAVSLERVHVESRLEPAGTASVHVRARLYNPLHHTGGLAVSVLINAPDGRTIHQSERRLAPWKGMESLAAFTIPNPTLWSPRQPHLYTCTVTVRGETGDMAVRERFGIRSFEFVPRGPFRLNGEQLLLRGTHRHEDHAGLGAAMTEELMRREMQLIKDLGANFIRLGHYQQSRIILDLCDELGLLVWEEIPWCRGGLGGERYRNQARTMLRNMIDQHFNHPSVILWGLGNENDWPGDFPEFDQQAIRAFMKELNDLAHQLDPTRLTAIRRCEFCRDIVDVYSPSIWAGWYRGRYTEYKEATAQEVQRTRRFFHAEWGGDSHAGRHAEDPDRVLSRIATGQGVDERGLDYLLTGGQERASRDGDWSESYICNLFDWHLKEQETMPWLTGAAQWIFKDFATPLRPDNPVPRVNQKGLVERDLTPKEAYYVFQSYWSDAPMIHIYGHSWPVRWGSPGEAKMVKVYSNCPEVELFVNGRSAGKRKRNSQDFPAAGLRWMVPFIPGRNVLRAVGVRDGVTVSDQIAFVYQTEPWGKPARLALRELTRAGDTVTVEAEVLDEKGVRCLDARTVLRFGITGDGRLLDNLGTSRGSRVVEAYNGRAVISLQRNGGKSVISISAKGLPTQFLNVE